MTNKIIKYITYCLSAAGGAIASLFGGFDIYLKGLLILMVLDFITALPKLYNDYSSSVMSNGLIKKFMTLVCIIVANIVDIVFGFGFVRYSAVVCFAVNEALSNLENMGQYIELPTFLVNLLRDLHDKADEGGLKDGNN